MALPVLGVTVVGRLLWKRSNPNWGASCHSRDGFAREQHCSAPGTPLPRRKHHKHHIGDRVELHEDARNHFNFNREHISTDELHHCNERGHTPKHHKGEIDEDTVPQNGSSELLMLQH